MVGKGFVPVLLLFLFMAHGAFAEEVKTGHISGRLVTKRAVPMAGGLVFFFNEAAGPPPSPDRYWRVPDEIGKIDNDGRFMSELVPGNYYLGAIKRVSGREVGPPQVGDLFLISQNKHVPKKYTVKKGETTDIGTIAEAVPFSMEKPAKGITAIGGTIVDVKGKPVAGALVFAFLTPAMVGKPIFVSDRTGTDGRYLLRVSEGGSYYLKVRQDYGGGPPKTGDIMGSYGSEGPVAVNVKTGATRNGVDIVGIKFSGRGRQ